MNLLQHGATPVSRYFERFQRPGRRWLVVGFAVLTGCSAQPRIEELTLHMFSPQPLSASSAPAIDKVLAVAAPVAWPGFDTPKVAYVRNAYQIDYYATHRWADTPARLLGPILMRAIAQRGDFRVITPAAGGVAADLRLDTEIVRLQQDFSITPSREDLVLLIRVVDVRERRVIASAELAENAPAPADTAPGGVSAANAALQRMLARVADFCAAAARSRSDGRAVVPTK